MLRKSAVTMMENFIPISPVWQSRVPLNNPAAKELRNPLRNETNPTPSHFDGK